MVNREQKIKIIRDIIRNNPTLSAKEHIELVQKKNAGIRKTDLLKIRREVLSLKEPSKQKREQSIPKKFRKIAPTPSKPKFKPKITIQKKLPIPFEQTKFGKMVKTTQKKHRISEKNAIRRVRKLLKIPKDDYDKLNQIDQDILTQYGY